jgi:phosphoglycolate phosphatase-like HAD superfamily hydrolase
LTGDVVLYRDLRPCDSSLPTLDDLRGPLGVPPDLLPRKRDAAYGRVLDELLRQAHERRNDLPLVLMLVVGDSANDRKMAEHLRAASGMPVLAFIGTEQADSEPRMTWEGDTASATRWSLLDEWLNEVVQRFAPDTGALPWTQTALLLDIDKTLLGPRGRNDAAINNVRAEAALHVAHEILGPDLDATTFGTTYDELCREEFHTLTLDNQDYVVYITLLVMQEVLMVDDVRRGIADGTLADFARLLAAVDAQVPPELQALHTEIRAAHARGDPTIFKAFRYAEFAETVAWMADGRLVLCREVMEMAQRLAERGVLCMAASDKPDQSAMPSAEQAASGMQPLHRTPALLG